MLAKEAPTRADMADSLTAPMRAMGAQDSPALLHLPHRVKKKTVSSLLDAMGGKLGQA